MKIDKRRHTILMIQVGGFFFKLNIMLGWLMARCRVERITGTRIVVTWHSTTPVTKLVGASIKALGPPEIFVIVAARTMSLRKSKELEYSCKILLIVASS